MRSYGAATLTYFQARAGVIARTLVWISARNRSTNAVETMGLWTGGDNETITIGGTPRLYYGAGNIVELPQITMQAGLSVRMHRLGLTSLTPEAELLLRGYDVRFAPVEIHRALYTLDTRTLVEEPHSMQTGFVDEVDLGTPAVGGTATCTLGIATSARVLTQSLPLKRSDAAQQLRSGDRMLRWNDVSGSVDVWWGDERRKGRS